MTSKTNTKTVKGSLINKQVQMPKPLEDKAQTHTDRLLQSQQEVLQKQANHKQQKMEFQKAQRECEEKLKEKVQEMELLKQTNSFLKFINEHIDAAESKANEDSELNKEKRKYYQELKRKLKSLTVKWQKLNSHTEINCIYSPFSDAVLNQYRQEVQELRCTQANQKARLNMLTKEMEETEQQIHDMEKEWNKLQAAASERASLLAKIKSATCDLSQNLWDMGTNITELIEKEATIELLNKIQEFTCDLKTIWEKASEPKAADPEPEKEEKGGKKKKGKKSKKKKSKKKTKTMREKKKK